MSPCHQKSTFFSSSLRYKDKTHKEGSLRKQTPFGLRGWLPRCVIMMNGAWQAVEWYCFGGPGERSRFSILPKFFFRYVASVLPVFSACGPLFLHAPYETIRLFFVCAARAYNMLALTKITALQHNYYLRAVARADGERDH